MKQDEVDFELSEEGKSFVMIGDDMRLTMSPRNWQLQKKMIAQSDTKNQKAGDVTWTSFRYYTRFESALNDIVHINTSKEFFNDARGLLEANAKVIKQLKDAFAPEYEIKLKGVQS